LILYYGKDPGLYSDTGVLDLSSNPLDILFSFICRRKFVDGPNDEVDVFHEAVGCETK
jgi:hypothetical protein